MIKFLNIFLFLIILLASLNANARPIVADAYPRKIDIDHKFKGQDVLIYGARNDAGNIIILATGPKKDYILRKKGKVAGIWTNIENTKVKDVYSFYSISSMRDISSIQNISLLKSLKIGFENLRYSVISDSNIGDKSSAKKITKEINDIMKEQQLYFSKNEDILFWGETLFRTFIKFPKNIIRGTYNIDIFLFNDGLLQSVQTMPIIVEQVGFEAFMFNFAHNKPYIYGILAVFLAIISGLFASQLFKGR
ncbi:MAG: TIGR02186 family protein [Rickettsiales bacterium]|nr:TIGR02186 family protein [Rickettsiales bacterium]